jgi:hypothetical protein
VYPFSRDLYDVSSIKVVEIKSLHNSSIYDNAQADANSL